MMDSLIGQPMVISISCQIEVMTLEIIRFGDSNMNNIYAHSFLELWAFFVYLRNERDMMANVKESLSSFFLCHI